MPTLEKCPKAELIIGMPEGIKHFCTKNNKKVSFHCYIRKIWEECEFNK